MYWQIVCSGPPVFRGPAGLRALWITVSKGRHQRGGDEGRLQNWFYREFERGRCFTSPLGTRRKRMTCEVLAQACGELLHSGADILVERFDHIRHTLPSNRIVV